jgi:hypothetical protein
MRRNPQRLAWTVLLASLFTCLVLVVAVPLTVSSFVNDSVDAVEITLDVQQGTVLVSREGAAEPIGVTTSLNNLAEASSIRATDENGQALLTIRSPHNKAILQTVSIYGNTDLDIQQARAPRFQQSTRPYQIGLKVNRGRVSTNVANGDGRTIETTLLTPQATTNLQEGSYSFDVNNDETQVTVREGLANVSAQGSVQMLSPQQRTVVKLNSRPSGILSPERNLVTNGNFRLPLDGTWEIYNDLQNTNELSGTVTIQTVGGQRSAVFDRTGAFHAKTGILQNINNRDVRDFRSLRLHFIVRVADQDVPVCGQLGSECPIMMQLDYKDENGHASQFWQGFYAKTDPNGVNPDFIVGSGSDNPHQRIVPNVEYTYDSKNLMETLKPQQITAIWFYASGHSYRSSVAQIELLGEQ